MILHLDMDCFFAQAEEERNPFHRGKVVVVCIYSGRTEDSGVVSTVNYEGRRHGIHSGMPIFQARKRAPPGSVFLPADREYYGMISDRIDAIVRKRQGRAERASIDEWFLEAGQITEAEAASLKAEIREATGLACTVGVAPSALGAKMAAAKAKPDGLLVLDAAAERAMVNDSAVEKVPGIGPKTAEALHAMGIRLVRDLGEADAVALVEGFGRKLGAWLNALGKGNYGEGLGEASEQSEVSRIGTLKEKTRDAYMILAKLRELEQDPREWLRERRKSYKTLSALFVTDDMKAHSKSESFAKPREWGEEVDTALARLVKEFLGGNEGTVRRVGIRFSNLVDAAGQTKLF